MTGASVTYDNVCVLFTKDFKVESLQWIKEDSKKFFYPKLPIKFDVPKRIMNEVVAAVEEMDLYFTAKSKVENTLKELNSCSS